jgi:hypothetical protein
MGRSALNGCGVGLQLCITAKSDGQFVRIIGDPCSHLTGAARVLASKKQMAHVMADNGAIDLLQIATKTLDIVLPADQAALDRYTDGAIWLALATERLGVALYVEAATHARDEAWDLAEIWLTEILPTAVKAHKIVAALRPFCVIASYGLEGIGPKAGRAKIYFRLTKPMDLKLLGIDPLSSPEMTDFLNLAMRDHGVDLDGLVMSIGISLKSGALVDAKADLCGHCLTYSDDSWTEIVADCTTRLGVAALDTHALLGASGNQVAFLGCGVDVAGEARLNLYLQPRPYIDPAHPHAVHAALNDAVSYLISIQHKDGYWQDFDLPVGASDQWVTAYVGMSLAYVGRQTNLPEATRAAQTALDWLCRDRPYSAGWGYNSMTGPDADSTTMALTLMRALGHVPDPADSDFLASRWRTGDGGVATYDGPDAWGHAHWDVTAYAYAAMAPKDRETHADDFRAGLKANLQTDGTWRAYWWRTPYYSTLVTLEALAELGIPEPVNTTVSLAVDGTFDIICAIGIAQLRGANAHQIESALVALHRSQWPDGRFPGGANLRVTDETCHAPWDTPQGNYFTDTAATITTATALRVLARLSADTTVQTPSQVT